MTEVMEKIDFPSNFNANNYKLIATVKTEKDGGYSNGQLRYSKDRNKYDVKDVPLSSGLYTNGSYLYRVIGEYSEFSIYVFEKQV